MEVPNFLEQPPAAPKPAALKPAALEGSSSGAAAPKKRTQSAPSDPAQKWRKTELAAKGLLPRRQRR
jgi:hypothetical protein